MFLYTIQHEDGGEKICQVQALSPSAAYDSFVSQHFGNGCCGFGVEVVCEDGTVIEF